MPVYMCNGCHPEHPCVLFAEGEFPLPDKCPWSLDKKCKWVEARILNIRIDVVNRYIELEIAKTKEVGFNG